MAGRPLRWRPHLVLRGMSSGAYWYVVWVDMVRWREHGEWTTHPPEAVPFMTRMSTAAKQAHLFAGRLNRQRGLAY